MPIFHRRLVPVQSDPRGGMDITCQVTYDNLTNVS